MATAGAETSTTIRDGIRAGMPFVLPTAAIGVSFGVLARSLDWGVVAPIIMSLIVYSGSAQFASTSVLASGGSVVAAVVAAALVNARFLMMGIASAPAITGGRLQRAFEGQAIIDSSWALAMDAGRVDRELMLGATIPQYLAWVGGTVVGVLAGGAIGDPSKLGLDAMFPAFFLALLSGELRSPRPRAVAIAGGLLALCLVPIVPVGLPIVAASAAAVVGSRMR